MEKYFVTVALFAVGNLLAFAVIWGRLKGQVETNKIKLDALHLRLDDKYMTTDKHHDLCAIAAFEMKAYIATIISESEGRIIDAVNGKQIRWGVHEALLKRDKEEDEAKKKKP